MSKKSDQAAMKQSQQDQKLESFFSESPLYRISPSLSSKISAACIERINERELLSIYALLAYVAYNQNVQQETVQMVVEARFGVDHVSKIHRQDYDSAVAFLVDLKMADVIN